MDSLKTEENDIAKRIKQKADDFRANVSSVMVGKERTIDLIFISLLCEGHVLIEDVPGVGKTLLAKATARSLDARFKRIQCTPDLLPSDILGVSVFNPREAGFEFAADHGHALGAAGGEAVGAGLDDADGLAAAIALEAEALHVAVEVGVVLGAHGCLSRRGMLRRSRAAPVRARFPMRRRREHAGP